MASHSSSNRLLRLLPPETLAALGPILVELRARDVLYEPALPCLYVYFPVNAIISLVSTMADGSSAEVAVVGREGMIGLAGLLGAVESPTLAVVQSPGTALRVLTATLRIERSRSPALRAVLDIYIEARLIQMAQTAACNRLHSVEARLARWLLAMADRIDTDHFTFPQELMAHMLGVQRPTVSLALQTLRRSGVISYRGRTLTIADRSGLERAACECHAVLRREFERLFRPPVAGLDTSPVLTRPPPEHSEGAAFETLREIAGRLLLASIREQRARNEAETANRAKDQFLAMVSHELRTPLNAIVGWSAILRQHPNGSPEHGLEVIQRNAEALLKLVEDLLDAAPSHVLTIQPTPVDLRQIVYSAIDAIRIAAHAKGVSLRTAIRDEAMPLLADADRLRQVFLNVLSNALKFTDAPGSIELCATMTRDRARVSIRDTGSGIGADVLPHVFDRFRQGSHSTAGEHGLGLGLSISQALIRLHAGTIEIASPGPGLGTTCTIELPLSPNLSPELSPLDEAGANR